MRTRDEESRVCIFGSEKNKTLPLMNTDNTDQERSGAGNHLTRR